jgi:protein-disulfide isomerase
MIDRRVMTAGLLSSVAALLAGCGGGLPLTTVGEGDAAAAPGPGNATFQPFGGIAPDDSHLRSHHRTTPATVEELMQPGPLKEMTLGRPDAKVTVIEYFSLTCPVCHAFHKSTWAAFIRQYVDSGKVYYIAREFPIGHSSGNASIALRCNEDNYFATMNRLIAEQSRWVSLEVRLDAIYAVAAATGLKRDKFDACLADKTLIANINTVKERGRELGVIGTPTFFINGRQMRGALTIAELAAAIDPLLG